MEEKGVHTISEICKESLKNNIISENTPPSIAAGSIYLVCNICSTSVTKKQVAKACSISEVTISKCYKKLHTYQKFILPDEILAKYGLQ